MPLLTEVCLLVLNYAVARVSNLEITKWKTMPLPLCTLVQSQKHHSTLNAHSINFVLGMFVCFYSVVCLLVVFFNHLMFFYSVTFGSLGRNQITDEFACSLAQALQVNQSFQKLE